MLSIRRSFPRRFHIRNCSCVCHHVIIVWVERAMADMKTFLWPAWKYFKTSWTLANILIENIIMIIGVPAFSEDFFMSLETMKMLQLLLLRHLICTPVSDMRCFLVRGFEKADLSFLSKWGTFSAIWIFDIQITCSVVIQIMSDVKQWREIT